MEEYCKQLKVALNLHLYYLALSGSLVLPDMCAGLESPNGLTSGKLYKKWADKFFISQYSFLDGDRKRVTADDCYGLRCSLLHQGRMTPDNRNGNNPTYNRIFFTEGTGLFVDKVSMSNDGESIIIIDVPTFVITMINAVTDWLITVQDSKIFKKNYEEFIHRRPNGYGNHIVGLPLIG